MSTNDEQHLVNEMPEIKQKLRKNKPSQQMINKNKKWKQYNQNTNDTIISRSKSENVSCHMSAQNDNSSILSSECEDTLEPYELNSRQKKKLLLWQWEKFFRRKIKLSDTANNKDNSHKSKNS
jgi:hypothetical protein